MSNGFNRLSSQTKENTSNIEMGIAGSNNGRTFYRYANVVPNTYSTNHVLIPDIEISKSENHLKSPSTHDTGRTCALHQGSPNSLFDPLSDNTNDMETFTQIYDWLAYTTPLKLPRFKSSIDTFSPNSPNASIRESPVYESDSKSINELNTPLSTRQFSASSSVKRKLDFSEGGRPSKTRSPLQSRKTSCAKKRQLVKKGSYESQTQNDASEVDWDTMPTEEKRMRRDLANARERARVQRMAEAYHVLQKSVPYSITNGKGKKLDILKAAIKYIETLTKSLETGEPLTYILSFCTLDDLTSSSYSNSFEDLPEFSHQEVPCASYFT